MKGIEIMGILDKFFKNYYLIKEMTFYNRNVYVFDYFGYYLFVYYDKNNNVFDTLVSEYY